ncbi:hypothetical protein A2U01_0119379 [Trifolium medium]|uniref:Uncharacterized protein n=1 Tax=Trifolium medium TaxID=97028 RepID=A0A392WD76_9FABA|nr:hypothetical protein [Trifolium medium]
MPALCAGDRYPDSPELTFR